MLIVGEKEESAGTVSVRKHGQGDQGSVDLSEFISDITDQIKNKLINN